MIVAAAFLAVLGVAHDTPVRTDHAATVVVEADGVEIECVVTLSRAAAFLEAVEMDADGDGRFSPDEQAATFARAGRRIAEGLEILINGTRVTPEVAGDVVLEMPFTKRYRFLVAHPAGWRDGAVLEIHNECHLDRSGEVATSVMPGKGIDLVWEGAVPTGPLGRDTVVRYRAGSGRQLAEAPVPVGSTGTTRVGVVRVALPVLLLFTGTLLGWRMRGRRRLFLAASAGVAAAVTFMVTGLGSPLDEEDAVRVFRGLHVRAEEDRQGIEIRRIKPIASEVLPALSLSGNAYRVRHRWRTYWIESHEAHRHARTNEFEAIFTVSATASGWRITDVRPVDGGVLAMSR